MFFSLLFGKLNVVESAGSDCPPQFVLLPLVTLDIIATSKATN